MESAPISRMHLMACDVGFSAATADDELGNGFGLLLEMTTVLSHCCLMHVEGFS
jgi:hypothetical protein